MAGLHSADMHTHTHTRKHTHTQTHIYTHANTHTQTHTQTCRALVVQDGFFFLVPVPLAAPSNEALEPPTPKQRRYSSHERNK